MCVVLFVHATCMYMCVEVEGGRGREGEGEGEREREREYVCDREREVFGGWG